MRTEKDFIGEKEIPADALYGIHSLRAKENFSDTSLFMKEWYQAVGTVKLAVYKTTVKFQQALKEKYGDDIPIRIIPDNILSSLIATAREVEKGDHFDHFIIPAVSGGAGTSINMNINEIIANVALKKEGKTIGDYKEIDPVEHANIYQSTNDVIPTALKITVLKLFESLEESINNLRKELELLEKEYRDTLRIGYTQMQEAVPTSYGRLFSSYNEALSRDWWRMSKCFERIKVVNIGGSAIGTGITVPKYMIMEIVNTLQNLTKLPVTRSENLSDATSNFDSFVEVHAILKAHAVNLEKMVSDIRLLSSGIIQENELIIPERQSGSSIMPGKVNPVIPEFVISIAHKVYANDVLISSLSAQGCLELNAYLPVIGNALIDSLKLLIAADKSIKDNLIAGIEINKELAWKRLINSPSITTALIPVIGYNAATEIAVEMKKSSVDVFEANDKLNFIDKRELTKLIEPQQLLQEGFLINKKKNDDEGKRK